MAKLSVFSILFLIVLLEGWAKAELNYADSLALVRTTSPKIEVYFICDKACARLYDYDMVKIRKFVNDVVARMNQFSTVFSITVSEVGFETWMVEDNISYDPSVIGSNPDQMRLKIIEQIAQYRKNSVSKKIKADLVMVISGRSIEGFNGAAYQASVCEDSDDAVAFVVSKDAGSVAATAQTALHEMGHAIGVGHDASDCDCDIGAGNCIMAAVQNTVQINHPVYSVCSIKGFAKTIKGGWLECVKKDAQKAGAFCGDGNVDDGEECDCGQVDCGCCDASTCKFLPQGNTCVDNDCKTCTGSSASCGGSVKQNFAQCDSGNGYCHAGQCESNNLQCQKYFGLSATVDKQWMGYNSCYKGVEYNSGGYLLYDVRGKGWSRYNDFVTGNGDGSCGLLKCVTNSNAKITDASGKSIFSYTWNLIHKSQSRYAYYYAGNTDWGSYVFNKYYPLIASTGTPCKTKSGAAGYCKAGKLKYDGWNWNQYTYSTCEPLP